MGDRESEINIRLLCNHTCGCRTFGSREHSESGFLGVGVRSLL